MQHELVVGDRVRYDDNFGKVVEVTSGGYRVRWNNGEEIEEMHGDLIRANPDDMCDAGIPSDTWPNVKPCLNVAEEGSSHCDEHQQIPL